VIYRKTVFVVGAGASIPYGYPSGSSMLNEARAISIDDLRAMTNVGPRDTAERFKAALRDCESDSLDSLLELRPDLDEIGRRYIAHRILTAENQNYDRRPSHGDWLSYLFNQMDTGRTLDSFLNNPVTFITYNYDRRIEYQISRGLHARYVEAEQEVDDRVTEHWLKNPVIHLHGSVGSLIEHSGFVPFGAREDGDDVDHSIRRWTLTASKSIRIVHQADGNSAEFQAARMALSKAECVIFLGFSFGRTNVDRLGFNHIHPQTSVFCSRHGMTDSEVGIFISQPLISMRGNNANQIGSIDHDCSAVLRAWLHHYVRRYAPDDVL
jgi:hypothetical protein